MKTLLTILASGLALCLSPVLPARAQAWPAKPITIVVPFPAGGANDLVARTLAAEMQKSLHQTVVVDNRPGATGTIGMSAVKRAAPDGYTLAVSSLAPFVMTPHLIKNLPFDPARDFDLLSIAVQAPNVLVVPAKSPYTSVAAMLAAERAAPGKLTFASSGIGASDHLTAELVWQKTGTTGLHVPYKGGAPAISDLLGGQIDASYQNVNAVLEYIRAGKLHALAVTGDKRSPVLPDVPTLAEAGVKDVVVYSWQAVAAPKGLPADVRQKLLAAIVAALSQPEVKKKFTDLGLEVVAGTPEQFAARQQMESALWGRVIETGKISAE